jgi:hypothetical protein
LRCKITKKMYKKQSSEVLIMLAEKINKTSTALLSNYAQAGIEGLAWSYANSGKPTPDIFQLGRLEFKKQTLSELQWDIVH